VRADVSRRTGMEEDAEEGGSAGHRVLVFAQLKAFLDIVERDVLAPMGVSYLRLDGSIDASARFSIVQVPVWKAGEACSRPG
jgi:TATA-binding protein-associated factor